MDQTKLFDGMVEILSIEPEQETNKEGGIYGNYLEFPSLESLDTDILMELTRLVADCSETDLSVVELFEKLPNGRGFMISFIEPHYSEGAMYEDSLPEWYRFWKKEDFDYDFSEIEFGKFEEIIKSLELSVADTTESELKRVSNILTALILAENQSKSLIMRTIEDQMNIAFKTPGSNVYDFTHESYKRKMENFNDRKQMIESFYVGEIVDYAPINLIRNFLAHRIDEAKIIEKEKSGLKKQYIKYKDKKNNEQEMEIELIFKTILEYVSFLSF